MWSLLHRWKQALQHPTCNRHSHNCQNLCFGNLQACWVEWDHKIHHLFCLQWWWLQELNRPQGNYSGQWKPQHASLLFHQKWLNLSWRLCNLQHCCRRATWARNSCHQNQPLRQLMTLNMPRWCNCCPLMWDQRSSCRYTGHCQWGEKQRSHHRKTVLCKCSCCAGHTNHTFQQLGLTTLASRQHNWSALW